MGANNKPFTHEYVESYFKNKGCKLLDRYVNSSTKMEYICKCGSKRVTSFAKFKSQKHGCRVCNGLEKYSLKYVKEYLENNGCKLLSNYTGANDYMKYMCSCGNVSESTFSNFTRGKRCKQCGLDKLSKQFKHDIEYVKQYFVDNRCTPLFDAYYNTHEPLDYICECGEHSRIAFADFQSGKRCWNCRLSRIRESMYKNGTGILSMQQIYIHSIIGGELNFPVQNSSLDIAFPDNMVYVEYDGGGHDLSVKLGSKTQDEFDKYERERRYALYRRNWKEIRIVSKRDFLPKENVLLEMFSFATNHFENGLSWIKFDIDNKVVESSKFSSSFDFGELIRIN